MGGLIVVAAAYGLGVWSASRGGPPAVPDRPPPSVGQSPPTASGPAAETPLPPPSNAARGCIRGGAAEDQVRASLGEPDSIRGGWWYYGRSSILFGYGAIQDYINGGELRLC